MIDFKYGTDSCPYRLLISLLLFIDGLRAAEGYSRVFFSVYAGLQLAPSLWSVRSILQRAKAHALLTSVLSHRLPHTYQRKKQCLQTALLEKAVGLAYFWTFLLLKEKLTANIKTHSHNMLSCIFLIFFVPWEVNSLDADNWNWWCLTVGCLPNKPLAYTATWPLKQ